MNHLKKVDPEIAYLIKQEQKRQANTLMMIPSENSASLATQEALSSSLGNKYSEGYPYKRYYQGQKITDEVESLVIERAKKLFNVPYANVQPYSGSPANLAVYVGLLKPHDKIMGLDISHGGHLTHGASASITSKFFQSIPYHLNTHGYIDFNELEKLALKEKPQIIVAGTTAYPRILDWKRFAMIADKVNAFLLADISHVAGLIAGKAYPSPVPYVHVIMTTTHKTLRGPRGAMILVTDKGLKKDPEITSKIARAVFPGLQGGPHINTIAGIGVALREAAKKSYQTYARQVIENAEVLARELTKYKFNLISGGTDSHLILIDLRNKNLLGNTVAEGCEAAGIILNRNGIPFDPNPPFYPSGLRLGTPGLTSRGMKQKQMAIIALCINDIVNALQETKERLGFSLDQEKKANIRKIIVDKTPTLKEIDNTVRKLCTSFPIKKTY